MPVSTRQAHFHSRRSHFMPPSLMLEEHVVNLTLKNGTVTELLASKAQRLLARPWTLLNLELLLAPSLRGLTCLSGHQ